ncbi:hypothetical protein [Anopheles stephensi orthophasmavirus]|nr:hypothetical protein [Anopheles stephensi orthophasmavirus]
MDASTLSAPGLMPLDSDDTPPVTFHRKMSEGGLHVESVEGVVIGTIAGLSGVGYVTVSKSLTRLIPRHKDLYNIVYCSHDPKRCKCRSTKVYQKILEELGHSRPAIVYCFLAALVKLRLHDIELTGRKFILTGDLSFLKQYVGVTPRSN